MLTNEELLALLRDGESDRVEFTESGTNKDKIGRAICAFANDLPGSSKPGVVFVGVDDEGKPVGLPITDLLQRQLGEFKENGNILPLPSLTVVKRTLNGSDVAVVITEPEPHPPVRYNHECWIRIGPRRGRATPVEEMRLAEKGGAGVLPFDQRAARPSVSLDELELGNFRDYMRRAVSAETLAENMRDEEHQLKSLGFMTASGEINNAALLCFARDLKRRMPVVYIQFVRYPGTEMSAHIKSQRELHGTVFHQLRLAEEAAENNITTPAIIRSPRRVEFPDYPFEALRQLIGNAVLHRSYEGELAHVPIHFYWFDDHVEIRSPGGPHGTIREDDFGKPGEVAYRNPKLAEALKTMGFIDRFGFGIQRARNALEANGNPPLEFQLKNNRVTVVLRKLDLDALTVKAAELVCCQALFQFKRDWDARSGDLLFRLPRVWGLGDGPGFMEEEELILYGENVSAKNIAMNVVREYTKRKYAGARGYTDPRKGLEIIPTTSLLVRMARIMHLLRELFGAEESEMREVFKHSLVCGNSGEEKARENDEAEFRRLSEFPPSLSAMEADVNREAGDERLRALVR